MAISNARLTTAGLKTTVYTSSGTNAVTTIIICNTGAVDLTDETRNASSLSLYLVPSTGTAGDTSAIVKNLVVPAGETVFFSEERVVLGNGDFISAEYSNVNANPTYQVGYLTITVSTLAV